MKNLLILFVFFLVVSCVDRKAEIENAMKQYDRLTFRMAADSLADQLFGFQFGIRRFAGLAALGTSDQRAGVAGQRI